MPVEIESALETGAPVSLVSEETYNQLWAQQQLKELNIRLKTYRVSNFRHWVNVCYGDQQVMSPLAHDNQRKGTKFVWQKLVRTD